MEKRPNAIRDIKVAQKTLEKADDKLGMGLTFLALGFAEMDIPEIERAMETFLKGLVIFEEIGDLYYQAFALHRIGYTYSVLEDLENTYQYNLRCLEINQKLGDLTL